ncbi:MAG: hypothetical protein JWM33_3105 [Caulobacteraceae bacterium]|nr:hypothetical protein [Caulobacteraceae bacterium]
MPTTATLDQPGGQTALLIIDMISPMDFEGADPIKPALLPAALDSCARPAYASRFGATWRSKA